MTTIVIVLIIFYNTFVEIKNAHWFTIKVWCKGKEKLLLFLKYWTVMCFLAICFHYAIHITFHKKQFCSQCNGIASCNILYYSLDRVTKLAVQTNLASSEDKFASDGSALASLLPVVTAVARMPAMHMMPFTACHCYIHMSLGNVFLHTGGMKNQAQE